jgi:hypothetical protein
VIGAAVMVAKIATGDIEDTVAEKNPHAVALGRLGGEKGGKARAQNLSTRARKRPRRRESPRRF